MALDNSVEVLYLSDKAFWKKQLACVPLARVT